MFVEKVIIVEDGTNLTQRSAAQLRTQAATYRRMAQTARMVDAAAALLKVADRFDALADQREQRPPLCQGASAERGANLKEGSARAQPQADMPCV